MLYQLWDLMPNFYADWVSSTPFVEANTWLPKQWLVADPRGIQLKQEVALNLNATMVVCFVIAISYLVARLRVMTAIAIGVTIATIGTVVYGTSPSVYVLFFGIVLFSLGEMLTGPKKTEYFSLHRAEGEEGALSRVREHPGRARAGARREARGLAVRAQRREGDALR